MRIYNLLIVDDEEEIREGLNSIVNWAAFGINVAAILSDGKEAIEYLKTNPVDIVLTDIKMSFVSGLEVAEYIQKNEPRIKVVMLSGYKEFELAKEAIKYNVEYFLLKPTDIDELTETFQDILNGLNNEEEKKLELYEENRKHNEVKELYEKLFFSDLISGRIKAENIIGKSIKLIGVEIDPEQCKCLVVHIKLDGSVDFDASVLRPLNEELNGLKFVAIEKSNCEFLVVVIVIGDLYDAKFKETIHEQFNARLRGIEKLLGIKYDMILYGPYNSLFDLATGDFFLASSQSENFDLVENVIEYTNIDEFKDHKKKLLFLINIGDIETANTVIDKLFEQIHKIDINIALNYIINILVSIENEIMSYNLPISKEVRKYLDYQYVLKIQDLKLIKQWFKKLINEIVSYIKNNVNAMESSVIRKAKKYIKENIEKEISLEEVADQVYLSSAYLSRLFKAETEESFTDFIIKSRIERSKELLENTQLKVYEISNKIGYKSIKYFYGIFKKNTGLTPNQYREIYSKKV